MGSGLGQMGAIDAVDGLSEFAWDWIAQSWLYIIGLFPVLVLETN